MEGLRVTFNTLQCKFFLKVGPRVGRKMGSCWMGIRKTKHIQSESQHNKQHILLLLFVIIRNLKINVV